MLNCTRLSLMILVALSFWLQLIKSFCIYNYLDDPKAEIDIYDLYQTTSSFKKVISPGGKECCPYTNEDCGNADRVRAAQKSFHFKIHFDGGPEWLLIGYRAIICETDGGLAFYGTATHNYATCYANGTSHDAPYIE